MPRDIFPLPLSSTPATHSGHAHPEDVDATLQGLRGVYASRDLYARYRDVVTEAGRYPATPNSFGRALKAAGYQQRRDSTGRHRCWIIEAS